MLVNSEVDGIIDVTSRMKEEEFSGAFPIPIVLGDRSDFYTSDNIAFIRSDNFMSGRIAAEHLIEKEYKTFVCIAGPVGTASAAYRRLEGFRKILQSLEMIISGAAATLRRV